MYERCGCRDAAKKYAVTASGRVPRASMQTARDHSAERVEAGADRVVGGPQAGTDQIATGQKGGSDSQNPRRQAGASNNAQGQAEAVWPIAAATSEAIRKVGELDPGARRHGSGELRVAERYSRVLGPREDQQHVDRAANLADIGSLIATAMTIVRAQAGHEITFASGLHPQSSAERPPAARGSASA